MKTYALVDSTDTFIRFQDLEEVPTLASNKPQWFEVVKEEVDYNPLTHYITPIETLERENKIYRITYTTVAYPKTFAPITPRQVRLILLQNNLLDTVETLLTSQDRAVQVEWEYATYFERDNTLVCTMCAALGLTEEQVDKLFTDAVLL